MERREFLEWLVATGGIASLSRLGLHDLESIGREAHASVAQAPVLDAHASALVTAAAERIIPATATPGATQAGVTRFVETMLAGWYPAPDRERFIRGLAMLDERSRARGSRDFRTLTVADQEAMLQQFDDEVTALRTTAPAEANAHWFAMLKYLTVWGYCTSEVGMRETLRNWPPPMRFDGNVAVAK